MKQDLEKILDMNKAGRITNEQAAELIAALTGGKPGARDPRAHRRHHGHFMEPLFNLIERTATTFADGVGSTSEVGGVFAGDLRENDIRMSRLESPEGAGYQFRNNTVRMSAVTRLQFTNAEVTDNAFDASRVDGLAVTDGAFTGCEVHMGSLEDVRVERGQLARVLFASAKCEDLAVVGESSLENARLHAGHIKHCRFADGSHGRAIDVTSAQLNKLTLAASELERVDVQSSQLSEISFEGTRWYDVIVRGVRMRRSAFVRTKFDDVLFSAGEQWAWKPKLFEDARFEDCSFTRALFSECRFKNVVLRNVHLADQKVQGVTLENMTFDGTAQFLKAIA